MKNLTLAALLTGAMAFSATAHANDDNITITSSIDTVSEYVFRGTSLGENSIQPATEITWGNFTVGSWYSAGFGSESDVQVDELDLYVGYSIPLSDDFSVDIGGTYYHFPQSGSLFETAGGDAGSYEFYGSVGLANLPLSPTATVYYDVTLDNLTLEGNIGHSFELPRPGWSLDLGLTGGHVDRDTDPNYQWATGTVSANKAINEDLSFYVSGNLTLNTEDDILDFERVVDANGIQ